MEMDLQTLLKEVNKQMNKNERQINEVEGTKKILKDTEGGHARGRDDDALTFKEEFEIDNIQELIMQNVNNHESLSYSIKIINRKVSYAAKEFNIIKNRLM